MLILRLSQDKLWGLAYIIYIPEETRGTAFPIEKRPKNDKYRPFRACPRLIARWTPDGSQVYTMTSTTQRKAFATLAAAF